MRLEEVCQPGAQPLIVWTFVCLGVAGLVIRAGITFS